MRDSIKYGLFVMYFALGFIYTIVDWFGKYGEDGMFFWVFIRPFVSFFKGIFWIFLVW